MKTYDFQFQNLSRFVVNLECFDSVSGVIEGGSVEVGPHMNCTVAFVMVSIKYGMLVCETVSKRLGRKVTKSFLNEHSRDTICYKV